MQEYVFIHGLGQTASSWNAILPSIPKPAHIACPELQALQASKEPTYANLYRAFADHCTTLPKPLNLCGLSLGGVLALNYALDNPTNVSSLVLIGAQYRMPRMLLHLQNCIFKLMPERCFPDTGFSKRDFMRLTHSMAALNFTARLYEFQHPTLIVCGERDSANKRAANMLAEKMPNAELQLVAGAGHELNVEAPNKLAAVLNAFYSRHKLDG